MRVSTARFYAESLALLQRKQSNLAELQNALATGKRINTASDDPVGAARLLDVQAMADRMAQYERNMDQAEGRMRATEDTLAGASGQLNRVRELALAAINGAHDAGSRAALATEIEALSEQLLGLANTQDANGEYLLAGTRSTTRPFDRDASGQVVYAGNAERRQVRISDGLSIPATHPGDELFTALPAGNGRFEVTASASNAGAALVGQSQVIDQALWGGGDFDIVFLDEANWEARDSGGATVASGAYSAPGTIEFSGVRVRLDGTPAAGDSFALRGGVERDLFSALDQLASVLRDEMSPPARANLIYQSLSTVDQALDANQRARAQLGTSLGQVDTYRELNAAQELHAQQVRSRIQDLDYAEAISQLQLETTTLQAAQQTFIKLQGLSLFNYLR